MVTDCIESKSVGWIWLILQIPVLLENVTPCSFWSEHYTKAQNTEFNLHFPFPSDLRIQWGGTVSHRYTHSWKILNLLKNSNITVFSPSVFDIWKSWNKGKQNLIKDNCNLACVYIKHKCNIGTSVNAEVLFLILGTLSTQSAPATDAVSFSMKRK